MRDSQHIEDGVEDLTYVATSTPICSSQRLFRAKSSRKKKKARPCARLDSFQMRRSRRLRCNDDRSEYIAASSRNKGRHRWCVAYSSNNQQRLECSGHSKTSELEGLQRAYPCAFSQLARSESREVNSLASCRSGLLIDECGAGAD